MKFCKTCQTTKPLTAFHKNKAAKDGKQACCKECNTARVKDWQEKNADRFKASWATPEVMLRQRARKYGLTAAELTAMIEESNNICAICSDIGELVVDHDHDTGKVRGLICGKCNRALGLLGDNIEGLDRAMTYLIRASSSFG